jgi:hypothetical protein
MQRLANPGKPSRVRKARVFVTWAVLGLGAALAAGCSMTHPASNQAVGDPLLGPAQPPAGVGQTTAQAGLPPVPSNSGASTAAALAGNSSLAITNADGWARQPAAPAGDAAHTHAVPVSQPRVEAVPKDTTTSSASPSIQPAGWSGGSPPAAAVATTDELDRQLKLRGVIASKLREAPGGVILTCAVPSAGSSGTTLYYHNDPPVPDYATAAQDIIRQIDADRAKQ